MCPSSPPKLQITRRPPPPPPADPPIFGYAGDLSPGALFTPSTSVADLRIGGRRG